MLELRRACDSTPLLVLHSRLATLSGRQVSHFQPTGLDTATVENPLSYLAPTMWIQVPIARSWFCFIRGGYGFLSFGEPWKPDWHHAEG